MTDLSEHSVDAQPSCYTSTPHSNGALEVESLIKDIVRSADDAVQPRTLGVMFRDLRVVGIGVGAAVQQNLVSLFYPRSIMTRIIAFRRPPVCDIISGFEGVVLPGEMLLVLGRPGSGCSTFLKVLANHREDYHEVLGSVFYDSFTSEEIEKKYRGDVIYCPEDDVHFPTLTLEETLEFASTMRISSRQADRRSRKERGRRITEGLMRIFGLEHAGDTVVGDASLRGISGGEKKRMSIAEVMSARGKLVCWDNSTRGLDSSTALQFIRALRVATDVAKIATVVSIYQVGEQLFEHFNKVCVISEGKMVYYGPAKDAKQYFMDMGYEPLNRQTTSDFLVASTDPNCRKFRCDFVGTVPRTPDEMAAYFSASIYGQLNHSSIESYSSLYVNKPGLKKAYDRSATSERSRHAPNGQSYTLSIPMQVWAVMHRKWQILKGDWVTQVVQLGVQIFQAIFSGTVFLRMTDDTSAYFSRGSLFFFVLFCGSILSMAEIPGLFSQRIIVRRQQKSALYYPFMESLAHTIVDIPMSFLSVVVMTVVLYFLAGLQESPGQFFTYLLFIFVSVLTMKAYFRSIAAFSSSESIALSIAGVMTMILVLYTGYAIPVGDIFVALRWINYFNPIRYAFESLLVNEFHTINGTCTMLVPSGPGYENVSFANQVCNTIGSQPGMVMVPGDTFVYDSFGFSYSHLWRNLGFMWISVFCLLSVLFLFTQYNKQMSRDTSFILYKEGSLRAPRQAMDEEAGAGSGYLDKREKVESSNNDDAGILNPKDNGGQFDIFSWKNIHYEVPVPGGMKKLLDNISGYVAPGKLTALMGESGAGKTVLLNLLAQRATVGVIHGDCFVNGDPLPGDFQAQTGYVQQMDIHVPETTVREALLFSARLRRPTFVPNFEKEAYVDKCLRMCGLEAYADAIVGSLDSERRKRTTIGVELAAKPKLLIFLDEPTSGLDSQSAWAIMMFLRELAKGGQAILCSIHQPSGDLFQMFDRLLLLRKGGQMVYFGNIGERSTTMLEYFERNGAPRCAANANPAEYMLDIIGAGATAMCTTDWHQIWKESPEAEKLDLEIERIHRDGLSRPAVTTRSHSQFATSWFEQLALTTHRGMICYWRNPRYIFSKLGVCVAAGLLIGFTFIGSTNSLQGCQNKVFAVFLSMAISVPMAMQLQGMFIEHRTVYEVRERPSKMFTWTAFLVSEILIEILWNIIAASLFFVCWYWGSGFDTSRAGLSYFIYSVVFPIYFATFGHAVAAISPNAVSASVLSCAFFSFTFMLAGVLQTYSQLGWWRWMYHLSPFNYIVRGLLAQALGNQLITCSSTELVVINPPSGMSCSAYMDPYITFAGGYLVNPDATTECTFCPFRTTDEWMELLFNVSYDHRWRNVGLILAFAGFNVICLFAGMYFVRLRGTGWSASLRRLLTKEN